MTITKHTPGNWVYDIAHGSGAHVVTTTRDNWVDGQICELSEQCAPQFGTATLEEVQANGKLIAAAPALLDALMELERAFGEFVNDPDQYLDGAAAVDAILELMRNNVRPALAATGAVFGQVEKYRGASISRSGMGYRWSERDDKSDWFATVKEARADFDQAVHADRLENEPGYAESCDDTPSVRGHWQDEIDAQRED